MSGPLVGFSPVRWGNPRRARCAGALARLACLRTRLPLWEPSMHVCHARPAHQHAWAAAVRTMVYGMPERWTASSPRFFQNSTCGAGRALCVRAAGHTHHGACCRASARPGRAVAGCSWTCSAVHSGSGAGVVQDERRAHPPQRVEREEGVVGADAADQHDALHAALPLCRGHQVVAPRLS